MATQTEAIDHLNDTARKQISDAQARIRKRAEKEAERVEQYTADLRAIQDANDKAASDHIAAQAADRELIEKFSRFLGL